MIHINLWNLSHLMLQIGIPPDFVEFKSKLNNLTMVVKNFFDAISGMYVYVKVTVYSYKSQTMSGFHINDAISIF